MQSIGAVTHINIIHELLPGLPSFESSVDEATGSYTLSLQTVQVFRVVSPHVLRMLPQVRPELGRHAVDDAVGDFWQLFHPDHVPEPGVPLAWLRSLDSEQVLVRAAMHSLA